MSILHAATLSPSKLELVRLRVPGAGSLIGGYRFDDPAGAVGVETLLALDGDGVHQVPLTYRSVPLDGGSLVSTCEHSVLGTRWVYDGTSDPVYVDAMSAAILHARHQEELLVVGPTGTERREPVVTAWGTGGPAGGELHVAPRPVADHGTGPRLLGRWPGQDVPALLAWLG